MLDSRPSCANQDFTSLPDSRLCYCDSNIIISSHSFGLSCTLRHHGLWSHQFVSLHQCVCSFDLYNFWGAQLPVPPSLNIPLWWSKLQYYPDYVVCDFLEFGWLVGLDYASSLSMGHVTRNHKGATDFPLAVDSYLSVELDRGAVIGPFVSNPFWRPIVISPLNLVPKPKSSEQRMILDLSWPSCLSINDAIPNKIYLSQAYSLAYPTIDTIANRVGSLRRGCLLFEGDLKQAYRQFPMDPFDYPLLGYKWNVNFILMLFCQWVLRPLRWPVNTQLLLYATCSLKKDVMRLTILTILLALLLQTKPHTITKPVARFYET